MIAVNYTYNFVLNSELASLNGIYTVNSILSYSDMLAQNLDLFSLTYKPNSLTQDQFNVDLPTIRKERIVKMTSVISSAVVYVPEHFFEDIPDGSVQKYLQLGLAIDLGIFADPVQLNALRTEVEEIVAAMTGLSNKTVVYTVKNRWMTTAAYNIIAATRESALTRVKNNYTDKLALTAQVASLQTLLAYYETALKALK